MMGHPELVTEMEREELRPLISTEGLEQLQSKYVQSVRVSTGYSLHIQKTDVLYIETVRVALSTHSLCVCASLLL